MDHIQTHATSSHSLNPPHSSSSSKLQLYSCWQSSCSWRVRIALNLKGLSYEYKAVNLSKGEQFTEEFRCLNPMGFVPVLVDGDLVVSDSFAILLYLDEKYPQNALLPVDLKRKAVNLQAASIISSSIQPLQMLSLLKYIEEKLGLVEQILWAQYHIGKGFAALEKLLKDFAGRYATGDEICLADIFLAPQISVAIVRFNIDMGWMEKKNGELQPQGWMGKENRDFSRVFHCGILFIASPGSLL